MKILTMLSCNNFAEINLGRSYECSCLLRWLTLLASIVAGSMGRHVTCVNWTKPQASHLEANRVCKSIHSVRVRPRQRSYLEG